MTDLEKARREAELYIGQSDCCSEELVILAEQFMELYRKSDAEVERIKACEHIAAGDERWELLRNECPSTAAVATFRDAYEKAIRALREIATHWALDYDHKYANTEQYRGSSMKGRRPR